MMPSAHLHNVKDLQLGRRPGSEEGELSSRSGSCASFSHAAERGASADAVDLTSRMNKLMALGEADKALIETLQTRLDEQRKQLEERQAALNSVQRNYEKLSEVRFRHTHRSHGKWIREA